ncbi:uncharacterized protein EDB93DRAFT_1243246 [Suillus bovinus]|uniref:uncharacterized protein n=1 Tax=Suillus bovinus TaxID=48563 RepID=UPI001B863957|nr:uncharacterized protein EDB93DRAFT_1243246 [Suillus bovinus]KAG2130672.1 hypothetical protein EDB93DRAFT_1243246 [Suillus bovinus]
MLTFARLAVALLFATTVLAGKRGLCWTYCEFHLNDLGVFNNGDGQVVAIYDYETYPPPSTNGNGGLGFIGIPIADLASRQASQGWATVFTLNEPDINGITPSQAASWYIQYINPLAIKKALPAVTSSATSGQGLSWVSQMISACAGQCYFDYINLSYIESAHNQFPNYQLVITEVASFQQAFPFLDGASYVQLYFPFVATSPALLQANQPSDVTYVGTGSCLYNDDGTPSAVGNLMY